MLKATQPTDIRRACVSV